MNASSHTLKDKAYHELKEFLVIALYLWVVFGLLLLYKAVILNEEHISYLAHGVALINALVLGKFVLIARAFHLGDNANDAPLIYPTLLKAALFSAYWLFARFSKTLRWVSITGSLSRTVLLT